MGARPFVPDRADRYLFRLEAAGAGGTSTSSVELRAAFAPVAAFELIPSAPEIGEAVRLFDRSAGPASSWRWNFGDGGTSTERDPVHHWSRAGQYRVSLEIANGAGGDSTEQTVTVSEAPACYPEFLVPGVVRRRGVGWRDGLSTTLRIGIPGAGGSGSWSPQPENSKIDPLTLENREKPGGLRPSPARIEVVGRVGSIRPFPKDSGSRRLRPGAGQQRKSSTASTTRV